MWLVEAHDIFFNRSCLVIMGRKRSRDDVAAAQPEKKAKFFDEDSEGEDTFKINADFAKRFEHNNKLKERQKCECQISGQALR
jgi:hypothetical protein